MNEKLLKKITDAHSQPKLLPGRGEMNAFLVRLLQLLYPELNNERFDSIKKVSQEFDTLNSEFKGLLSRTKACDIQCIDSICSSFFEGLEQVYDMSMEDAWAICEGDPAAKDKKEVVRTYPGFLAIAIYRIAHSMVDIGIPYLPRIFTEYAHANTGIDIHPAAQIGRKFCIDHGTGIVIGETTNIGDNVKIYQGVTLGALSVSKDMAMTKRHPTIGDDVVIYSGATILGGDTVIGTHSIIGGNVWLTGSVEPHSTIYYKGQEQAFINV